MSNAKSKCEKELRKKDPTDKIIRTGKDVVRKGKDVGRRFRRFFGKKRRRKRAMTEEEKNAIVLARQLMGTDTLLKKHGINLRSRNARKIMHMEKQDNQTAHIEEQDKHRALERYTFFCLIINSHSEVYYIQHNLGCIFSIYNFQDVSRCHNLIKIRYLLISNGILYHFITFGPCELKK